MTTQHHRKPGSALRNIAMVLLFVVFVLGLTAAVQVFRRDVVLMLPAEHEARLARRDSPDNAFTTVAYAIKQLPVKPGDEKGKPSYAPDRWWDERRGKDAQRREKASPFEPESSFSKLDEPSLAKLCWIDRPDGDPALMEYIRGCQSAGRALHIGLESPFCICPDSPRFHNRFYDGSLMQLGRSVAALGCVQFSESPSLDSLQPLIDAIRLARLLSREDDLLGVSQGIEGPALQQIRHLAVRTGQATLLAQALNALGPGYLPRHDVLRTLWLDLDDQIGAQKSDRGVSSYQRRIFRTFAFSHDIQRLVAAMKDRKDELLTLADHTPPEMVKWICGNIDPGRPPGDLGKNERRIVMALHRAAELSGDFVATQIVLALETCKAETGQYPSTLDALAPKYIAVLPRDPYTLAPFGYTLAKGAYTIYSYGEDLADNGGDPVRDRIIIGGGTV